jgi:hypothetical protein
MKAAKELGVTLKIVFAGHLWLSEMFEITMKSGRNAWLLKDRT